MRIKRRLTNLRSKKISIDQFYKTRKKILIIRRVGGLGDILMQRMLFEDFKRVMPDCEIIYACPESYHEAVNGHPYIDEVVDVDQVDKDDYFISYDVTTACAIYESKIAPKSDKHRSDIWANHCGLNLKNHNMHFDLSEETKNYGKQRIRELKENVGISQDSPSVLLSPISAMVTKNLTSFQVEKVIKEVNKLGFFVFGLHTSQILMQAPTISDVSIKNWMGVIHAANYVISVDTSTLHCAGGMGKPTVGIFTWVNGQTYTQYYKNIKVVQIATNEILGCVPKGESGCFGWPNCPLKKGNGPKPCLTDIKPEMIVDAFKELINLYPVNSNILWDQLQNECKLHPLMEK